MIGIPADPRAAARQELAGAAFLFLVLLVVSSAVLVGLGADADGGEGADVAVRVERGMIAQLVGSVAALGAAWLWPSRADPFGDRRALRALGVYVAFLPLWVLVAASVSALWDALGWPVAPQPHLEYFASARDPLAMLLVALTVCVAGPVIEEVIFRGHLWTGLATLAGPRMATAASAVAFGLVHAGSGSVLIVPITALGALFGWLRARSGGLLAPVVAHVAHNTVMVVVVTLAPEFLQQLHKS